MEPTKFAVRSDANVTLLVNYTRSKNLKKTGIENRTLVEVGNFLAKKKLMKYSASTFVDVVAKFISTPYDFIFRNGLIIKLLWFQDDQLGAVQSVSEKFKADSLSFKTLLVYSDCF